MTERTSLGGTRITTPEQFNDVCITMLLAVGRPDPVSSPTNAAWSIKFHKALAQLGIHPSDLRMWDYRQWCRHKRHQHLPEYLKNSKAVDVGDL